MFSKAQINIITKGIRQELLCVDLVENQRAVIYILADRLHRTIQAANGGKLDRAQFLKDCGFPNEFNWRQI